MKRSLIAALVALVVFSLVYGLADTLGGISSTKVGANTTVVASCDTDGVTASYATSYSSTVPGYKVGIVTIDGIGANPGGTNGLCAGKTMKVTLTGALDTSLAERTVTLAGPGTGTDIQADFSTSNVSDALVTGIAIVIYG